MKAEKKMTAEEMADQYGFYRDTIDGEQVWSNGDVYFKKLGHLVEYYRLLEAGELN